MTLKFENLGFMTSVLCHLVQSTFFILLFFEIIVISFPLSFSSLQVLTPFSLLFFKSMVSFFIVYVYVYVCVYIYICIYLYLYLYIDIPVLSNYYLVSLYNITHIYIFSNDLLVISNQLLGSSLGKTISPTL